MNLSICINYIAPRPIPFYFKMGKNSLAAGIRPRLHPDFTEELIVLYRQFAAMGVGRERIEDGWDGMKRKGE